VKASDIAYLAALVEKASSNYPGRGDLLAELQDIYRRAQRSGMVYRVPVMTTIDVSVS